MVIRHKGGVSLADLEKYKSIINNQRPISKNHPPLSTESRAAQFSSFDALVGFKDVVRETTRKTDKKIELDEYSLEELNRKLNYLRENLESEFTVKITYFEPDKTKEGGKYLEITDCIVKFREYEQEIIMGNSKIIPIKDIFLIEGDCFDSIEE